MSDDKTPVPTAEERRNRIDSAVEAAEGSNQSRDSRAAQEKEKAHTEESGMGKDNTQENKNPLLAMMHKRLEIAIKNKDAVKAAEIRAAIKEMESM